MRAVSGDETGLSPDGASRFRVLRKRLGFSTLGIAAFFVVFWIVGPIRL
jgi:hypothetical protein